MKCPRCNLDREPVIPIQMTSKSTQDNNRILSHSLFLFGFSGSQYVDSNWHMMVCKQCSDDLSGKSNISVNEIRNFISSVSKRSK